MLWDNSLLATPHCAMEAAGFILFVLCSALLCTIKYYCGHLFRKISAGIATYFRETCIFILPREIIMWYEEIYEVGNVKSVVAFYKNIPPGIRKELDDIVIYAYDKLIFNVDLFDAAMLLLSCGYLPHKDILSQYHFRKLAFGLNRYYLNNKSGATLKIEAIEYTKMRAPDDTIVLVFKDDILIGTMTLSPFQRKADIIGLQYIHSDMFKFYKDAPGLEIGRLAKGPQKDILSSAAMVTAFIIIEQYFIKRQELLQTNDRDLFVCGETFKHVIDGLEIFFPTISRLETRLNFQVLDHPYGMYFVMRDVLGSLPSTTYLLQFIDCIKKTDGVGGKIQGLIERGTGKPIEQFNPEKYKVYLFHFYYNISETQSGFKKMEEMMKEMTNG